LIYCERYYVKSVFTPTTGFSVHSFAQTALKIEKSRAPRHAILGYTIG